MIARPMDYLEFLDTQPFIAQKTLANSGSHLGRELYSLQFQTSSLGKGRLTGAGFSAPELASTSNTNPRKRHPPEKFWNNIVATLEVASMLRLILVKQHHATGLRIHAAYRPKGGAKFSQHKKNRALDLQLLLSETRLAADFYKEAAIFWSRYGDYYKMGLGLYCGEKATSGVRIHIDTGYKKRTWQMLQGKKFKPPITHQLASHDPYNRSLNKDLFPQKN